MAQHQPEPSHWPLQEMETRMAQEAEVPVGDR
jgi:hypothetical protein